MTTSTSSIGTAALDPSFAGGTVDLKSLMPNDVDVVIMADCLQTNDDGILIAADMVQAPGKSALIKLTAAGALDTAFGGGQGYVIDTYPSPYNAHAKTLIQLGDGRVAIIGDGTHAASDERFPTVAVYFPDGSPDTSFGDNGRLLITELQTYADAAAHPQPASPDRSLQSQTMPRPEADGKIVFTSRPYDSDYVIQVTAEGKLDLTFNDTGFTQIKDVAGRVMEIRAVERLASGSIMAAGTVNGQAALARLTPAGDLDLTFNGNGFKLIGDPSHTRLVDLFITAGEKIRVIGQRVRAGERGIYDGFVSGVTLDGSDDADFETSYHDSPILTYGFGKIRSTATDNLLWCLWSVGDLSANLDGKSMLFRVNPNGHLDTTFGENGYQLMRDWSPFIGLAVQRDLKCIVTGMYNDGMVHHANVSRYRV